MDNYQNTEFFNPYAWSTGLLIQNVFCQPSKFMTGGMVPMKGSNMAVGN